MTNKVLKPGDFFGVTVKSLHTIIDEWVNIEGLVTSQRKQFVFHSREQMTNYFKKLAEANPLDFVWLTESEIAPEDIKYFEGEGMYELLNEDGHIEIAYNPQTDISIELFGIEFNLDESCNEK